MLVFFLEQIAADQLDLTDKRDLARSPGS